MADRRYSTVDMCVYPAVWAMVNYAQRNIMMMMMWRRLRSVMCGGAYCDYFGSPLDGATKSILFIRLIIVVMRV